MNTENKLIEDFLQTTCRFITTEERAKDIRDELLDHLENHKASFYSQGFSEEEATKEALKQMGDPCILGKSYKDPLHNRCLLLAGILGIMLLLSTLRPFFSTYHYFSTLNTIMDLLILTCYIPFILLLLRTNMAFKHYAQQEPLFHIQTYKKLTLDEWVFRGIALFISFPIILLTCITFFDCLGKSWVVIFEDAIDLLDMLLPMLLSIFLFTLNMLSQNHAVAYTDGLLTATYFISWQDIQSYRWITEHIKGKTYYKLEIKKKKGLSSRLKDLYLGKAMSPGTIKVSIYQKSLLTELLATYNIPHTRYM